MPNSKKIDLQDSSAWQSLDWDDKEVHPELKRTDAQVNRARANRLKANNPEFLQKFQGENNPNYGNRGELNPLYGKVGHTFSHTEDAKIKISESHKGEKNHMYGKTHSPEVKKKISESQSGEKSAWYGKHHTKETKLKQSLASKGKPKSEDHKRKLSQSKKGKEAYNKGIARILVKCLHCGKEGGEGIMHRWHFDNCKHK
jgi:hypothetical protein